VDGDLCQFPISFCIPRVKVSQFLLKSNEGERAVTSVVCESCLISIKNMFLFFV
jgi:hypothetical protein